jgi:hypothetical protein
MIDSTAYPFYVCYVAITIALAIVYLQVKSTELVVITTKEFRKFQTSYLAGYSLTTLVCNVSIYSDASVLNLLIPLRAS